MPRRYAVTFENITVSAAQDLISVKGSTGKVCRLISIRLGCAVNTLATAQSLRTRVQFLPVTVTAGSGGSAATPQLTDPGDTAASCTGRINDTTQATTSGTAATVYENGFHIYAGEDYTFPTPIIFGLNQQVTYGLLVAPSGTVTLSGRMEVEEMGL